MIYKTSWGQHIDISKLFSVSEIYDDGIFDHHFNMFFQLFDKPIIITEYEPCPNKIPEELQGKHDEIINIWKKYKLNKG